MCRKLDFPEVINADDLRNDIYVTVYGAEFNKSANYEYTAELCDENENPISVSSHRIDVRNIDESPRVY